MVYLDNAATSFPKPPEVIYSVMKALAKCGNPGRGSHELSLTGANVMLECRSRLCSLLNTDDEARFIFCLNCTDALNMAIKGMTAAGGHVVTTALEHNSVLRPLSTLQARGRISYSVVLPGEDGFLDPEDVAAAIRPDTRLVAVTHASNVTGAIQPVKEIIGKCHMKNVPVLVDAAQTAGKIEIDLKDMEPDLMAFPGHKGLLGPMGTGVLYVRKGCPILSFREGGTGSSSMCLSQPLEMPDYLESGTPATCAISGLAAGLYLVNKNFAQYKKATEHATARLFDCLSGMDDITIYSPRNNNAGVITFNIKGLPSYTAADLLDRFQVSCRAGFHCAPLCHKFLGTQNEGAVRFSTGPFNTNKDVRAAAGAVGRIIVLKNKM